MSNQEHSTAQNQEQPQNLAPRTDEDPRDLKSRPNDAANQHESADSGLQDQEYPPQLHAGKVGLGPHFYEQNEPTIGDQFTGIKETVKGKLKHDQHLQEQGHDRMTGELKRRQMHEQNEGPFANQDKSPQPSEDKPSASEPSDRRSGDQ